MKAFVCSICFVVLFATCSQKNEAVNTVNPETDTITMYDGRVITYEKKYPKPLLFLQRHATSYSENYKKRIRKVAEYYLDVTAQKLVIDKRDSNASTLGYSMEENDWEGVHYTQIGIFNKVGINASTLQWLFYEPKTQRLYEFNLATKKLQEVK